MSFTNEQLPAVRTIAQITEVRAYIIYSVLIKECGAPKHLRDSFADYVSRHHGRMAEFRFGGNLGFGGKFYVSETGEWRIDCYPEDCKPESRAKIARATKAIEELARDLKW